MNAFSRMDANKWLYRDECGISTLTFARDLYAKNYNQAIMILDDCEVYCSLTVNLMPLPKGYGFIDVKCPQEIISGLEKEKLIVPTGKTMKSGFCTYQLYEIQTLFELCKDQKTY